MNFKKAIPELTVDDNEKLRIKNQKLEKEKSELEIKNQKIENLESQNKKTEKILFTLMESIGDKELTTKINNIQKE